MSNKIPIKRTGSDDVCRYTSSDHRSKSNKKPGKVAPSTLQPKDEQGPFMMNINPRSEQDALTLELAFRDFSRENWDPKFNEPTFLREDRLARERQAEQEHGAQGPASQEQAPSEQHAAQISASQEEGPSNPQDLQGSIDFYIAVNSVKPDEVLQPIDEEDEDGDEEMEDLEYDLHAGFPSVGTAKTPGHAVPRLKMGYGDIKFRPYGRGTVFPFKRLAFDMPEGQGSWESQLPLRPKVPGGVEPGQVEGGDRMEPA